MRTLLVLVPLAALVAGCVSVDSAPPASSPDAGPTCNEPGDGFLEQIQQRSMEPTLAAGDVVLVVPAIPRLGSIVVFTPPAAWTSEPTAFVKRVIGTAGDVIEVRPAGVVVRNGQVLAEPYVRGRTEASPDQQRWVVPAGQLFVLGDNREQSADSRVFGSINSEDIRGVATWLCDPREAPLVLGE